MIELNPKHYTDADIASIMAQLAAPPAVPVYTGTGAQDKDPIGAVVVITEVRGYQTAHVVITEHSGW